MTTILTKRSNTPGAVPVTANLTNAAGGAELAVNTADKRLFTLNSANNVVEVGTNPSSLTCADVSATVLRAGSGTITNLIATTAAITDFSATVARVGSLTISSLSLSNATVTSATITTLTSASATITNLIATSASITTLTNNLTLSGGTANGVLYLNGSKAATSGSALVFDGTNLGIGTASPGYKLDVQGNGSFTSGASITTVFVGSAAGNGGATVRFLGSNTSKNWLIGNQFNVNGALEFTPSTTNGGSTFTTPAMLLDSSGNLGLGVTPSAWASGIKVFEFGSIGGLAAAGSDVNLLYNVYYDGANKYRTTGYATNFQQASGAFKWYTAPSGTAGNTISFGDAKMTLDASGNLGVGATSPSVSGIDIVKSGGTSTYVRTSDGTYSLLSGVAPSLGGGLVGTTTNHPVLFYSNNTERARITSGGNLLVGTTTDSGSRVTLTAAASANAVAVIVPTVNYFGVNIHNQATSGDNCFMAFGTEATFTTRGSITYNRAGGLVAYSTTSDYRAKDVYGLLENTGTAIDALKVYNGKMKGATQERPMLIAHEAQEVAPYAVGGVKDEVNEDGTPKYQQMDHSSLVPLLIAEIQSLRARVAQLESK